MLRHSPVCLGWRPKAYVQKVMPLLASRAKVEFKIGRRVVLNRLKRATDKRLTTDKWMRNSVNRAAINAAAREHGSDFPKLTNDLARQDVVLNPTAMKTLAVYEPMSFRAVMELAASGIAPPTPKSQVAKPQRPVLEQLDEDVRRIQATRSAVAADTELRDAWKRYVVEAEK
uniref:Uncharacterized protein n=1 Tax=Neobodo designis TaxID=312471 RepID=A0A7S1PUJ5_NEODS|mmetsp:Transcript_20552/g.63934  ORF Transcript_20552/g.63934 Transcript_20552/m.63934 type:complete len:172 (+) Transcript_20552:26-541(+)